MKKKISLLLCVLMTMLCFVGCSSDNKSSLSAEDKELLIGQSEFMFTICSDVETVFQGQITEEYFDEYVESASDFELNSLFVQMGLKVGTDDFKTMLKSWDAAIDECGKFEECGEFKASKDGTQVSAEVTFKNGEKTRKATIVFTFDSKQNMKSMDVSAKYSTGEIMGKAGMNTLLGMGTVFAVLIFLAFLIYLMKYITVVGEWIKSLFKSNKSKDVLVEEDKQTAVEATELTDDLELVAVITAAIAAHEGTRADGFVVRSIRRRPSNNWN